MSFKILSVDQNNLLYVQENEHYSIERWLVYNGAPLTRIIWRDGRVTDWSIEYFDQDFNFRSANCLQCKSEHCCPLHADWCSDRRDKYSCDCFDELSKTDHHIKCLCLQCTSDDDEGRVKANADYYDDYDSCYRD